MRVRASVSASVYVSVLRVGECEGKRERRRKLTLHLILPRLVSTLKS
jgi:hypothetical protein